MPTSHSLSVLPIQNVPSNSEPLRIARLAVLNGYPIPHSATVRLEALGVNVAELEQRLIQNMEFRR